MATSSRCYSEFWRPRRSAYPVNSSPARREHQWRSPNEVYKTPSTGRLAVLRASSVTPTVVVSLPNNLFDSDFKTKTRQNPHRVRVCALGHGCDLKVVASPMVQQRFIWETDRDLIPEGVAENTLARHTNRLDTSQLTEAVSEADRTSSQPIQSGIFCSLFRFGTHRQARYGSGSDLLADQRVDYDRSAVSTFVSTLERNGLVDVHGPQNARYAVVTEAGLAALDTMRPIIGKQSISQSLRISRESRRCWRYPCI